MVKTVVKKEGATQTCGKCGTDLVCRMKEYGGNFAPTLQWQNYSGEAHFKTTDGKTYVCNVPDEEETTQTRIPHIVMHGQIENGRQVSIGYLEATTPSHGP